MAASHEETPTAVRVVYVVSRIVEVVNLAAGGNVLSQQMRRLHDLIKNDKERNRQEHAQELWDTEPRTAHAQGPAAECWTEGRRLRKATAVAAHRAQRSLVSLANRFALLQDDLEGHSECSGDSCSDGLQEEPDTATRVLDWLCRHRGRGKAQHGPRRGRGQAQHHGDDNNSGLHRDSVGSARVLATSEDSLGDERPRRRTRKLADMHTAQCQATETQSESSQLADEQSRQDVQQEHQARHDVLQEQLACEDSATAVGSTAEGAPAPVREEFLRGQQRLAKLEEDYEILRQMLTAQILICQGDYEPVHSNAKVAQLRSELALLKVELMKQRQIQNELK